MNRIRPIVYTAILAAIAVTANTCGGDSNPPAATEQEWVATFCESAQAFNDALAPSIVDDDGVRTLEALPGATRDALDVLNDVEPPDTVAPLHTFAVDRYEAALQQDTSTMTASTKEEALATYFAQPNTQVSFPSLDPTLIDRLNTLADETDCGIPAPFGAT